MNPTLETALRYALDALVLSAVVLLAYLDKIPSEVVISVVSVYAGAIGARRSLQPKNGASGTGSGVAAMLVAGLLFPLLGRRHS